MLEYKITGFATPMTGRYKTFHNFLQALFCRGCESIIGPTMIMEKSSKHNVTVCKLCNCSNRIQEIGIPYIFRYLSAELSSVSINLKFHLNEHDNTIEKVYVE